MNLQPAMKGEPMSWADEISEALSGAKPAGNCAAVKSVPMPRAQIERIVRPLFLPLRTEFYDLFVAGHKRIEYRKHGPRWNAETCRVRRPVTISKGYGKANRKTGVIVGFEVSREPCQTAAWKTCYGDDSSEAACISILLDDFRGPYGCLCQSFRHRILGDGCVLCNDG